MGKTNAVNIAGTTEAACCDTTCAAHTCGAGKHLKNTAASIVGAADNLCCDTDITGKCSGNTASSTDVTCGTNKILKSNAAAITSTAIADCCDHSCASFVCGTGLYLKASPATIAGAYKESCCSTDPCAAVPNTCGECKHGTNGACTFSETMRQAEIGDITTMTAYTATYPGYGHCRECCASS